MHWGNIVHIALIRCRNLRLTAQHTIRFMKIAMTLDGRKFILRLQESEIETVGLLCDDMYIDNDWSVYICFHADKVEDGKKFPLMARLILADTLEKSLSGEGTLWNGILGHLCFANNESYASDKTPYHEFINYLIVTAKINIKKSELMNIVPVEMYDRIIRILHLNCITITYNEEDVATGLFGLASMFNHSCDPNVEMLDKMEDKSGFARFHCLHDVEVGEELCIQYAGKNDSYEDRQQYLMWNYGFQCQCKKCIRD